MTIRSINWTACVSMAAAILATNIAPAVAQGQIQAVPRAGVAFSGSDTVRGKIESIDTETRTIAFTAPDGRLLNLAIADGVGNLDRFHDGSVADITYSEVVTVLNLRQKGPGSQQARREGMAPNATDADVGRFTLTVVAVDLAANKVSVIDGSGGAVRSYAANSMAKQDMLKTLKVGDVVIGMTTPLTVTAIAPAK